MKDKISQIIDGALLKVEIWCFDKLWDRIDANKDGQISREELISFTEATKERAKTLKRKLKKRG